MRIAINGMGRIGRLLYRRLLESPEVELVAVNDIMDTANLEYLLKYDSVYGTFTGTGAGKQVHFLQCANPLELPWKELKVDVVLECTGVFTSREGAELHLQAGASKVMLSSTGPADVPLLIYGFNQHHLTPETTLFSPGGCMTNCSIHILYILNAIGIESAQLNILHSYTTRQSLVDGPHKHLRRGRAAAESIIPVEVDLFQSLDRLFPVLHGKIATLSTRVPVANGAMADFTVQMKEEVSVAQINQLFKTAAEKEYDGVLEYTTDPLVSLDIKGNTHSCIVDGTLTSVVGRQLKLIAWFDNEYGYTSRMIDWLLYWKQVSKSQ
jgi:glyceraldehyde 3-phosphate dehydrogenase